MDTGYKEYAEIIRNRLEKQLKKNKVVNDTQFEFRKKTGKALIIACRHEASF